MKIDKAILQNCITSLESCIGRFDHILHVWDNNLTEEQKDSNNPYGLAETIEIIKMNLPVSKKNLAAAKRTLK